MALDSKTRRWAWAGAIGLVAALVGLEYVAWTTYRDRRVAAEVEAVVFHKLQSLPASDPAIRRYGPFVRLEGEGFERGVQALGLSRLPIVIERKAVFRDAWAHLTIIVHPGPQLRLQSLSMLPTDAEAAGLVPEIRGGELQFEDWQRRCGLRVQAEHPRCPRK